MPSSPFVPSMWGFSGLIKRSQVFQARFTPSGGGVAVASKPSAKMKRHEPQFCGHCYFFEARNSGLEMTALMRGLTPVPCMSPAITVTLPHTAAKPLGYAAKTGIARNGRRLQSGKTAALRDGPPRKQCVKEFEAAFGMEMLVQSIMQFAQVDD